MNEKLFLLNQLLDKYLNEALHVDSEKVGGNFNCRSNKDLEVLKESMINEGNKNYIIMDDINPSVSLDFKNNLTLNRVYTNELKLPCSKKIKNDSEFRSQIDNITEESQKEIQNY